MVITEKELSTGIVFITSYYDRPLAGLCKFNGKFNSFEIEPIVNDCEDDRFFKIKPLVGFSKFKALYKKWLFEICVGKHWSYPQRNEQHFYWKWPVWFWKIVFNVYYWWRA